MVPHQVYIFEELVKVYCAEGRRATHALGDPLALREEAPVVQVYVLWQKQPGQKLFSLLLADPLGQSLEQELPVHEIEGLFEIYKED